MVLFYQRNILAHTPATPASRPPIATQQNSYSTNEIAFELAGA